MRIIDTTGFSVTTAFGNSASTSDSHIGQAQSALQVNSLGGLGFDANWGLLIPSAAGVLRLK